MTTLPPFLRRPLPSSPSSPRPPSPSRLALLGLVGVAGIAVLLLRLWFLQVVSSSAYAREADSNRLRTLYQDAPRGEILDRRGAVIVANRQTLNVIARPQELGWNQAAQTIPEQSKAILTNLAGVLGTPPPRMISDFRRGAAAAGLNDVVLASDASPDVVAYLAEHQREFPGIGLQSAYVRAYPQHTLAAQILGQIGKIGPSQIQAYRRRGYFGNESVGQSGVEASLEQYLRGRIGERQVEVNSFGQIVGAGPVSARPAVSGDSVYLTLDDPTQRALQSGIAAAVARAGSPAGAGVALDPNTGEVLAIASVPSFDPSVFVNGNARQIKRLNRDPREPQVNRALAGTYPAGSTFKPFTAIGLMENGYLSPDQLVNCPSYLDFYKQRFKNFRLESFPPLTLPHALEVSCDTYFYQMAVDVYRRTQHSNATPLQDWARAFGYGHITGLDAGGSEAAGLVPDVRWKVKAYRTSPNPIDRIWRPGDSINLSVGQGALQVTPIQQAVAYAAIANGGKLVTPRLIERIVAPDGRVVADYAGKAQTRPVETPQGQRLDTALLGPVREGLYLVANGPNGTAAGVFARLPDGAKVAGKTGTAENFRGNKQLPDHSWFVGYAPASHPRIVVAVVIANGGTGASAAAPVVCRTITTYLHERGVKVSPSQCGTTAAAN